MSNCMLSYCSMLQSMLSGSVRDSGLYWCNVHDSVLCWCSVQWLRSYLQLLLACSERTYRQTSPNHTEFRDRVDYFRPYLPVSTFFVKCLWIHNVTSCLFLMTQFNKKKKLLVTVKEIAHYTPSKLNYRSMFFPI
jgi:hypothetical protein